MKLLDENIIKEPQLDIKFNNKLPKETDEQTLRMLSLFSGCGGMDLGFEGGFAVLNSSINKKRHSDFIDYEIDEKYVQLKKTKFKTVFANDILEPARNAWVNYFSKKRGHNVENYNTDSIVDLVKMHQSGTNVFPENIDIVTGGFPCQDFSIAGKRNGFKSHRSHNGKLLTETCPTEETRGNLYMWMKKTIEITKPKVFIAKKMKKKN